MMAILHDELGIIDTLLYCNFVVIMLLNLKIWPPMNTPVFFDRFGQGACVIFTNKVQFTK